MEQRDLGALENAYIKRTEEFDRSKRNLLWFSGAAVLVAFATDGESEPAPLLGVAIEPVWLSIFMIMAVGFALWPFLVHRGQVTRLNMRLPSSEADKLEKLQAEIEGQWRKLSHEISETEERLLRAQELLTGDQLIASARTDNPQRKGPTEPEIGLTAFREALRPITVLFDQAARAPGKPIGQIPGWKEAYECHQVPPAEILNRFRNEYQRLRDEQLATTINSQAEEWFKHRADQLSLAISDTARLERHLERLSTMATDFRKLKVGVEVGEAALFRWHGFWFPLSLAILSMGLLVVSYWDDYEVCAESLECLPWIEAESETLGR